MEKFFKLKEHGTTAKTEILAGFTTFMTMAYILAVNPSILSATGMDPTAVLLATCLASFVGTLCMALMANLPFALSAGMGLNAYMAYTVVLGMGYSWQVALLAVFVEGVIFIILSPEIHFLICSIRLIAKPEGEIIVAALTLFVLIVRSPRLFLKPCLIRMSYASSKL